MIAHNQRGMKVSGTKTQVYSGLPFAGDRAPGYS